MPSQNFGYYEEIFFPEDENEWIDTSPFKEVKSLWEKSRNMPGDKNYRKACELLDPFFEINFDKERMIDNFAKRVTEADEDGWTSIGEEERLYGLKKSIFQKYDEESYETEDCDSCAVVGIDFTERDDEGHPIKDSHMETPYITLIATKNTDVKKEFETQQTLEEWESKNEFELGYCFSLELSDDLTSYIDEDGDETSGYSSEGGWDGVVVFEKADSVDSFSSKLQSYALGSFSDEEEDIEISEEAQQFFEAIYSGDIEKLKSIISNDFDVNQPLVGSAVTSPLAIAFSSIYFQKKAFKEIYGKVFEINSKTFKEHGPIEEIIYFLTAQGADLGFQMIPGLSYLGMSLSISEELTNFLLSFGIDVSSVGNDALLTAASEGKVDYIKQFLDLGAEPNFSADQGTTAIMFASQGEDETSTLSKNRQKTQIQIIDLLLDKGADINAEDQGGDCALSNAVRTKNVEIVRHLLENKANPNGGEKKDSISPYKLALEGKSDEIQKILEEHGVKKGKTTPKTKTKTKAKVEPETVPKGKVECPSCNKYFTKNTIDKWGGTCGTCYRKKNPRKKSQPKSQTYAASNSGGCWDTADSIIDGLDSCFEVIKMLAIMGFVIFVIVTIIIAIFS